MFIYAKREMYPINIKRKDVKMASLIYAQLGGANGELGAAIRYFMQRTTMPDERGVMLLTDIAAEELSHVEMIQTLIYQLTKDATIKEMEEAGLACSYVMHGKGIPPVGCDFPFDTKGIAINGDWKVDLIEDMCAEEKARITYEHLIDLTSDNDVKNVLLYLRQREVVHYNRFKDLMEVYQREYKN